MKKKLIIFILLMLFAGINNINAVTSSGSLSSSEKEAIFPVNDKYCTRSSGSGFYSIGGVFLRDSTASSTDISEKDYIESKEVYETSILAKSACDAFVLENKSGEYLCKDTPSRTAYSCNGTIGELSSTNQEYLEKYITGGQMFETENACLTNCMGTCTLESGYSYRYVKPVTNVNESGSIETVGGRMFQTADGDYAFCVQPAKAFQCPYYKSSGNLIPQYCLNTEFNLSSCKDNFKGDYRCGLAYIALKGTDSKTSPLSETEYGVIDMAMRMWATSFGHLSGMQSTTYPLGNKRTTSVNFYGLTANRVVEDANYLEYGFACSTSSKNHGIICDYKGYDTYKKALKLYNETLHVNELDEAGNKVPKLITTTLGDSGNTVQMTNPTGKECKIGDANCKVIMKLYDSSGKEVPSDSTYCDKNYCYAKYTTENLCKSETQTIATIEIQIKDFEVSGRVKEFHHCTDPSNKQIMYTVEAEGKETTNKTYVKKYTAKVACECKDDSGTLKSKTDSKKYCDNYNKANSEKNDYNGVEEGYIADPSMSQILNSCSGEKYFREKSYETDSDTCKIYCRDEIKFYMANKEKVYSGMQFRYELEEKITNNLGSDHHLTAIVLQQKQCLSEIDSESWLKRYNKAQKAVAEAWNEWKKWDSMKYYQETVDHYPKEEPTIAQCTLNCNGYGQGDSAYNICMQNNGSVFKQTVSPDGSTFDEACKIMNEANFGTETEKTGDVCSTKCVSILTWRARFYQVFEYATGNTDYVPSDPDSAVTDKAATGYVAISTLSCDIKYNITVNGYRSCTFKEADEAATKGESCSDKPFKASYTVTFPVSAADYKFQAFENLKKKSLKDMINDYKYKWGSDSKGINGESIEYRDVTGTYNVDEINKGECIAGKSGDINYVINKAEEARKVYNAKQAEVRNLLTALQACNMYGSGISGEPDIKNYTLTKAPYSDGSDGTGSGGGSSGSLKDQVGGGEIINKTASNYSTNESDAKIKNISVKTIDENGDSVEYKSSSMKADPNTEYVVQEVATTANSKSIKRKILKDASCVDDTCADLSVSYKDEPVFGALTEYDKVTGIVKTDDLFNAYCEGSTCYRNVNSPDEEDGWASQPSTTTVNRIVCDTTNPDPGFHTCKFVKTTLPDNDYVSFKVTTEIDFYRPKNYYTKAFTGEVVESNSSLSVNSKQYSALGKNVYPVSNDKESGKSGLHPINYTFTNLGISKFGSSSNYVNLDNYEYECAYEVYNNTTGYDCEVKYDSNGNPMPSECSNFCLYVENTVPDLECIQWNNTADSKGYGFVYRNVDLSNLFPSGRKYGNNWSNASEIISEIQNSSGEIFTDESHLELSVTLSTDAIKKIREYNRYKNTNAGGYLDNSLISCESELSLDGSNYRFANCRSTFIDEIQSGSGVLGIKANKIVRSGSVIK